MVITASTGGIGRHVASVAPRLVARGFDVTVHASRLTLAAHDVGVPATALDAVSLARGVAAADVVHAHGYKAAALALPYARVRRVPLVVTWHNAVLGLAGDAAIIQVTNPAGWQARAWVYVGSSAARPRTVRPSGAAVFPPSMKRCPHDA